MASASHSWKENFPPLSQPVSPITSRRAYKTDTDIDYKRPRQRRRSSGLGGELRGDTGAPSLSTLNSQSQLSPSSTSPPKVPKDARPSQSTRRKARSLLRRWKTLSFKHTWVSPLILLVILLSIYAVNPTPSNPLHYALFLSYQIPRTLRDSPSTPVQYGKGPKDFAFVAFYTIVLSFTREFLMQRFIRPLSLRAGIRGRAKQCRFMEQMYTAIYFSILGPIGLYVMSRTPVWYFNTTAMYEGFPHKTHDGVFKAYYLLQASYWTQQAIVLMLQLEKPRKDFKELVGHHIITLALIWSSYRFHFTYMGLAVYITHDISDFFLATSKTLNYLDSIVIGPYFALFVGVWVYLRHYINISLLYSILTEFRTVGPFELNWETEQYKCWISQLISGILLASLQAINLFWLFLILRIARNYVFSSQWQDERSDNEELDDEPSKVNSDVKLLVNGQSVDETRRRESHAEALRGVINSDAKE